jgi:hypothetical protein
MMKSIRFLGKYFGQILLVLLAFAGIVLVGLFLTGGGDNLFTLYYGMFPMMGVMISGLTMFSMGHYYQLALAMNARRAQLFWANQLLLLLMALLVPILSILLQMIGQPLVRGASWNPLYLALLMPLSLVLGEIALLTVGLSGKVVKVVYGVVIFLYIIICGVLGGISGASLAKDDVNWMVSLFQPGVIVAVIAVLLVVAAALAFVNYLRMKKAVVRV